MSNLFGNISGDPRMQRQALISRFSAARVNLLLMIIFTAINLLTLTTGIGSYFLFSATVPYLITDIGMALCGMYPQEYYEGLEGMIFLDKSFFVILLILSLLILVIYLLCWIFSKKNRVGFLIGALAMFSFDTLVLLMSGEILTTIVDIIIHIWVIVILSMGISANYKLKQLPKEEVYIEGEFRELPADDNEAGAIEPKDESSEEF